MITVLIDKTIKPINDRWIYPSIEFKLFEWMKEILHWQHTKQSVCVAFTEQMRSRNRQTKRFSNKDLDE